MKAWLDFLKKQESTLGNESIDKWLRPLKIAHFDSGNLYLEARDSFQILWFEEHVRSRLKSELLNSNFRPIKVHLTLVDATAPLQKSRAKSAPIPLLTFTVDKLNPLMTFEHFLSSTVSVHLFRFFCELTGYNPLTKQLETPTTPLGTFNPIYLWGPTGAGKTHLLMALAHAFKERGLNALYVRAETFTEHVVSAIRASEMQGFRKHYRQVDILLIDDIHQLARKYATQEEFFHTFNTLHTSGRQIILSSKCTPSLLEEIEPRLVSRFEWGINLHFDKLQTEDLKEVLKRRAEALNFPLSEEVSHFLLDSFSNSNSLYKALETLVLRCHLEGDVRQKKNSLSIDVMTAKQMLAEVVIQEQKIKLSAEKIYTAVCSVYGIRPEDLLGKSQSQECSIPRQIAMYLCRKELLLPFQGIGRIFNRDHSTVMTSVKQIEKKLEDSDRDTIASLVEIRRHF